MRYAAEPCGLLLSKTFVANPSEDWRTLQENVHDPNVFLPGYPMEFTWTNQTAPLSIDDLIDQSTWADHNLTTKQKAQGSFQTCLRWHEVYYFLYRDSSRAAVYRSARRAVPGRSRLALPANYIIRALENEDLHAFRFVKHFILLSHPQLVDLNSSDYFQSLISFAQADQIYATLPQAEINLTVFEKTLYAFN